MTTQLHEDDFLNFIGADKLSCVYYYRKDDIFCERVEPIFEEIITQFSDRYQFAKVNVETDPRCAVYAETNGVVPVFVIYKRAQIIGGNHGPISQAALGYKLAYIAAAPIDKLFFSQATLQDKQGPSVQIE